MFLFWILYIYHHRLVKHFSSIFFKSLILVQIALYFSYSFSSSIRKDINLLILSLSPFSTLNVLIYPLILGIIKTNALIVLSKYLFKYLELVFVLINFEITILSTLTSQIFTGFFCRINFFFCFFCLYKSQHYYNTKKSLRLFFS